MDGVQAYDLLSDLDLLGDFEYFIQRYFTEKINRAYSKPNVFNFWREGCFMLKFLFLFVQYFVIFILSESMQCIHHSEAKFFAELIFKTFKTQKILFAIYSV